MVETNVSDSQRLALSETNENHTFIFKPKREKNVCQGRDGQNAVGCGFKDVCYIIIDSRFNVARDVHNCNPVWTSRSRQIAVLNCEYNYY